MLHKIDKVIATIATGLATLSFLGCIAMVLLNIADIVMSKTIGTHVTGAYELTERLLMCTVFAAFAYAQVKKTHINMTIIVCHLPRALKFGIFGFMGCLSVFISVLLSRAAVLQALTSIRKGTVTDVLYIPLYPFFYFECVCMAIFAITLAWDVFLDFAAIKSDTAAEMVTRSWV